MENNAQTKKNREMNWDNYSKRHIALKFAYLGWNYRGLAIQQDNQNTVEQHILWALKKVKLVPEDADHQSINFQRSGRTDIGVSAFSQVLSFHSRSNVKTGKGIISVGHKISNDSKEIDFPKVLNRALPSDIRVLSWTPVDTDFSARFSTVSRQYRYFFRKENKNIIKMKEAGCLFLGLHDFRNFCKMDAENVSNFERTILEFDILPYQSQNQLDIGGDSKYTDFNDIYYFKITGTAFLWHQIRCMVGVLFLIGEGLEELEIITTLLDIQKVPRKPLYDMVDGSPLVLYECNYESLEWQAISKQTLNEFDKLWLVSSLHSSVIYSMYNGIKDFPISDPEGISSKSKHVPLLKRKTEKAYDERNKLKGNK
uniref:tRNA pseudouridine synthase n=1 Tax=Arcella intermedia TaxID=1963864 RepID=A0A6B2L5Z3_9EUKA